MRPAKICKILLFFCLAASAGASYADDYLATKLDGWVRKQVTYLNRLKEETSSFTEAKGEARNLARLIWEVDVGNTDALQAQSNLPVEVSVGALEKWYLLKMRLLKLLEEKKYTAAAQELDKIPEQTWPSELKQDRFDIHLRILSVQQNTGLFEKTFRRFEKSIARSQRREEIQQLAAEYFLFHKMQKQALLVLDDLVGTYPFSASSRWAMALFQGSPCDEKNPPLKLSLISLQRLSLNSHSDSGLREFVLAILKTPVRVNSAEERLLTDEERVQFLLRTRFQEDALVEAKQHYSKTTEQLSPGALPTLRAKILLAQAFSKVGDQVSAVRHASEIIATTGDKDLEKSVRDVLADGLMKLRYHVAAAEQYRMLGHPASADAVYRWLHFWNLYLGKRYEEALALLNRPGYVPARDQMLQGDLHYWRGKILSALGREEKARQVWGSLVKSEGVSYYTILAARQLKHNLTVPIVDELTAKKKLSQKDAFELRASNIAPQLGSEVSARKIFEPILWLHNFGRGKEARVLLRGLPWPNLKDRIAAETMRKISWFVDEYRLPMRLASVFGLPPTEFPNALDTYLEQLGRFRSKWLVQYPPAFERLVTENARKQNVDPRLVLALMRGESFYDTDAVSGVGALGLMQIMPYTGIRLARQHQSYSFVSELLRDPEVNILFGVAYLRRLLSYYQNNFFLATAAYNAGPAAVDKWLFHYSDLDPDVFVETVSFKETRRYVKNAFRSLALYSLIYDGDFSQLTSEKLPTQPNLKVHVF